MASELISGSERLAWLDDHFVDANCLGPFVNGEAELTIPVIHISDVCVDTSASELRAVVTANNIIRRLMRNNKK